MRRLTVDKPASEMNMVELAYNCMYAKEGWAWYRDFEQDMDLRDYIRKYNAAVGGDTLPDDNEDLGNDLLDNLQYDIDDVAGQVALTYRLMWALADIRERLKAYEDSGLEPEEIMDSKMLTGWIPVEEQLPGTERILITNGEFVKEGYRMPDGIWKYGTEEDKLFSNLSSKGVIAWMPLPEPFRPLE